MNYDITFCAHAVCPLTECFRHIKNIEEEKAPPQLSFADFAPTCRDYLYHVLQEISEKKER